jgi:hypothetical protein
VEVLNLSDHATTVEHVDGQILVGTDRRRDGASVAGAVDLGPWESVVVSETGP